MTTYTIEDAAAFNAAALDLGVSPPMTVTYGPNGPRVVVDDLRMRAMIRRDYEVNA